MSLRIGYITCAHLHVDSYQNVLSDLPVSQIGLWDHDAARGRAYAESRGLAYHETLDSLLSSSDAVIIVSENVLHAEYIIAAATANKHILCEKPVVITIEQATEVREAVAKSSGIFMTAFPCRYSPVYQRLKERLADAATGKLQAICATNRGTCPHGWFVQPELSGGGAMIDHVVHVADLLHDILGAWPMTVHAAVSNNVYGEAWEDCAMLTLTYQSGVFVTLDSSWSRPGTFKTWGDVTMNVVTENGVIEVDLFGQEVLLYADQGEKSFSVSSFASNIDALMIDEFLSAIEENRSPRTTLEDGIGAAMVALAGYRSVAEGKAVDFLA